MGDADHGGINTAVLLQEKVRVQDTAMIFRDRMKFLDTNTQGTWCEEVCESPRGLMELSKACSPRHSSSDGESSSSATGAGAAAAAMVAATAV